jgi:hypothetical protein
MSATTNTAVVPDDVIEKTARAMAAHTGWSDWDAATDFTHTLSGNNPDDERDYWRDLARIALAQPAAAPLSDRYAVLEEAYSAVDVATYTGLVRGPFAEVRCRALAAIRAIQGKPAAPVEQDAVREQLVKALKAMVAENASNDGEISLATFKQATEALKAAEAQP